jgi:hypothetical protein
MPRARSAPAQNGSPTDRLISLLAYAAAVVLVLAVPLVWDSGTLDMFRGPKRELALAAWSVLAAAFVVRNLGGGAWRDPWWLAWGGVLAGGAASAIGCPEHARALSGLFPLALAAVGWGALRQLSDDRRRSLGNLVVWAGTIEAAIVLLFLSPSRQPDSFALLDQLRGRYAWIGTMGNPADVATFLVLPALLAAQRGISRHRHRLPNAAAAALMVAVVLGTRTLTAFAALAVGVLVLLWRAVPSRRRLPLMAAAVALMAILFAVSPLATRVSGAIRDARGPDLLWIGSGRAAGYAAAASMLAARPAAGVGFDLFEANSFRYQSPDSLAERGRVLGLATGFGEAHNDLLQYAAETGLVGLALALAGLGWAAWHRPRGDAVVASSPLVVAAALLALSQFPLHLAAIAAQWVVLAALALPPLPAAPAGGPWQSRLRVLAVGVLAGAGLTVAWQRYHVETMFLQGRALSASLRAGGTSQATTTAASRAALTRLVPMVRWLGNSWEAMLILGNLAVDAGDTRLALSSFGRALALAERPEVRFDVGMALLMAGEREAGMAHLMRAVELNPAIFRVAKDPALSRALRDRLDASGYGPKHPWMYEGTPAATP